MDYKKAWAEIVAESGVADIAAEAHGHDLLDGIPGGKPNAPLEDAFAALCRQVEAKTWADLEPVLRLMRTVDGFGGLRIPQERVEKLILTQEEARGGKVQGICTNTSAKRGTYSSTWGTPQEIMFLVHDLFGPIDVDLASSAEHNKRIHAKTFFSESNPCPKGLACRPGSVLWANPPGPCSRVKEFWEIWCWNVSLGCRGAFLVFSGDHLRQLEWPGFPLWVVCLRKRLRFVGAEGGANFPSYLILSERPNIAVPGHLMEWTA